MLLKIQGYIYIFIFIYIYIVCVGVCVCKTGIFERLISCVILVVV